MDWLWLLLPLGAALFYSLRMFVVNYLTDQHFKRERIPPDVLVLAGVVSVGLLIIGLTAFFGFGVWQEASLWQILLLLCGGVANVIAFIPYYQSYKYEETTGVEIMVQMSPVLALGAAAIFLGETISWLQGVAFIIIFSAVLLLIIKAGARKKRKMELHTASLILIACVFWVAADLLLAPAARDTGLPGSFVWYLLGELGALVVAIVMAKKWRKGLMKFLRRGRVRKITLLVAAQIFYATGEVLYYSSLIIMPIALAGVLTNVMGLMIVFILGIVFSILWPKFGREELKRRTIVHHLVAVVLVAVGIILLNQTELLIGG